MVTHFTIILLLALLIQMYFWLCLFRPLALEPNGDEKNTHYSDKALRLIICSNRRSDHWPTLIQMIKNQKECRVNTLIIDNSQEALVRSYLEPLVGFDSSFEIEHFPDQTSGKKSALMHAFQLSEGQDILVTDDDCIPSSEYWARDMLSGLNHNSADVVLGYSPVERVDSTLMALWTHFEAFFTALLYLSFSKRGWSYMGVGRNILYKKNVFKSHFLDKHLDLASGDDDLLVNALSKNHKVSYVLKPTTFVKTFPPKIWASYFRQKRRHFSTGHRYRFNHILLLSAFNLSHILFYSALITLAVLGSLKTVALVYVLRLLLVSPIAMKGIKKLKADIKFAEFLFLDFALCLFYLLFAFAVVFPKKDTW